MIGIVAGAFVFDAVAYLWVFGAGRWPSFLLPLSAVVGIAAVLAYHRVRSMPRFWGRIGVLWGLGLVLILATLFMTMYWDGLNLSIWAVLAWLYRKDWSPYRRAYQWAGLGWLGHAVVQLLIHWSLYGRTMPWGLYMSGICLGLVGTGLFYRGSRIP